jgi:hypothetical protein
MPVFGGLLLLLQANPRGSNLQRAAAQAVAAAEDNP